MRILDTPADMQKLARHWKEELRSIYFIPTMGALHLGHMSLIEKAKTMPEFRHGHDRIVVSIFVNPMQFNDKNDLSRYPRPLVEDQAKCESMGVDAVFIPSPETMYPQGFQTRVTVDRLSQGLCGKSRPGHFDGVALVVLKLFHTIQADWAFFGEKDFQQLAIVKRMVLDLNLPTCIISCAIVREHDGLAMSSRNVHLSQEDRQHALTLYRLLEWAKQKIDAGEIDCATLRHELLQGIKADSHLSLDYAEFVDEENLESIQVYKPHNTRLLLAVWVGRINPVRLIDNMKL